MLNLTGKNAIVTGIANNRSIAWGIAQQLHLAGANLGITYLPDDRNRMEKKVAELVEPLNPSLFLPCNVQNEDQIQFAFEAIRVTQTEVGNAATFLCSDLASGITGQILYVDSGYEVMGMTSTLS